MTGVERLRVPERRRVPRVCKEDAAQRANPGCLFWRRAAASAAAAAAAAASAASHAVGRVAACKAVGGPLRRRRRLLKHVLARVRPTACAHQRRGCARTRMRTTSRAAPARRRLRRARIATREWRERSARGAPPGDEKTGRMVPEVAHLALFCYYFCSRAPPQIQSCLNTSANDGGGPNPFPKLFATVIFNRDWVGGAGHRIPDRQTDRKEKWFAEKKRK